MKYSDDYPQNKLQRGSERHRGEASLPAQILPVEIDVFNWDQRLWGQRNVHTEYTKLSTTYMQDIRWWRKLEQNQKLAVLGQCRIGTTRVLIQRTCKLKVNYLQWLRSQKAETYIATYNKCAHEYKAYWTKEDKCRDNPHRFEHLCTHNSVSEPITEAKCSQASTGYQTSVQEHLE